MACEFSLSSSCMDKTQYSITGDNIHSEYHTLLLATYYALILFIFYHYTTVYWNSLTLSSIIHLSTYCHPSSSRARHVSPPPLSQSYSHKGQVCVSNSVPKSESQQTSRAGGMRPSHKRMPTKLCVMVEAKTDHLGVPATKLNLTC